MRTLSFGSTGASVQLLQLGLNRAGFGTLETDGIFGAATDNAVIRFQTSRRLAVDGIVGRQTQAALEPYFTGFVRRRIRAGESFFTLSREFNTSVEAIRTANPAFPPEKIPVGTELVIPLAFPVVPDSIAFSSALLSYCVQGLTARYPFLTAGEYGRSAMGRPLWQLRLGRGENRVLYTASHHANEWIGSPLLLRFTEELCRAYAGGGSIFGQSAGELLSYTTLRLVPAVNPDGIDLVTGDIPDGPALRSAEAIARQYPAYPFPEGWKANLQGIDLNLQYPAGWEQARENKFALGIRSPAPADYVGTAPLTAPESRALYALTVRDDPALILAYHTQGEVIYWRYLDYEPPGSRDIAGTFSAVSGYAVEETPFASGFAGYKDWFIQSYDRPGYTIEAGLGENPLPLSQLGQIYRDNLGILTLGMLVT